MRRQTSFGPSANSHSGSKNGSQAQRKSGAEVDLNVCGIQAVKGTATKALHSFLTNLACLAHCLPSVVWETAIQQVVFSLKAEGLPIQQERTLQSWEEGAEEELARLLLFGC